jgi:hypothetical protein
MTVDRLQNVGVGVVVLQITILVLWAVASAIGALRLGRRHVDVRSTKSISTSGWIAGPSRCRRIPSDVGTPSKRYPECG